MLRDALKKTKKIGLGQIVVRGQGSIVAIKPCGKGLMMETLALRRRGEEGGRHVRRGAGQEGRHRSGRARRGTDREEGRRIPSREIQGLLHRGAARTDRAPSRRSGRRATIEETPPASNVINLMDALKRSVGGGGDVDFRQLERQRQAAHRRKSCAAQEDEVRRQGGEESRRARPAAARPRSEAGNMPSGSLREYHRKRDFKRTAEPKGAVGKRSRKAGKLRYLIQKHAATPAALRFPAGMERRADELGGAEGAERKPRRQAARGRMSRIIRSITAISKARSRRASMAAAPSCCGTRAPGRRTKTMSTRRLKKGKLGFIAAWRAAAGQLGAGAAAQALAEGQGQLAADQGA